MGALDYLKQFESIRTVKSYKCALRKFFKAVYEDYYSSPESLEDLAVKYFRERRDYEKDVQTFAIVTMGMAPKTRKGLISAVRIFLLENNVELRQLFWRRLRGRIKGSRPISDEKIPSNSELRAIMMHLPVIHRAFYLTVLSSGMRIGEAAQLTLDDLGLESDPAVIRIRPEITKTGNRRITFISSEAREAISGLLKIRENYLAARKFWIQLGTTTLEASNENDPPQDDYPDHRLFPFRTDTSGQVWKKALAKAGLNQRDPRTKTHLIHPHVLRKFFRSQLGMVIPIDIVEALMGHEEGLTAVYRKYPNPEKTLAGFYRKGEHMLLVFTEAEEDTNSKDLDILLEKLKAFQLKTGKPQIESLKPLQT